jgi:hypothetical protein
MNKTRLSLGALALGVVAIGAACAPPPAPGVPSGTTTTSNVEFACIGTGNSAGAVIANQTTTVAISHPANGGAAGAFSGTVDYGNLNLAAAPSFLDLNSAGVVATATTTGLSANPSVAANNFVGNGASIDLKPMAATGTSVAGSNTITAGTVTIQVGTTGFICTPVGSPASATFSAV